MLLISMAKNVPSVGRSQYKRGVLPHKFGGTEFSQFSIGVEEELMIVDPETMDLGHGIEEILNSLPDELEGSVKPELMQSVLEVATAPCPDVATAGRELAELRAKVRMIQCSSCGAPVDLGTGSACAHCRAPVSMLDPKQVETVVRDLKLAEERRTTEDPLLAARLVGDRLAVDRLFREPRPVWASDGSGFGLVEAGLAAIAGLFAPRD
jgi:hypothetical protein